MTDRHDAALRAALAERDVAGVDYWGVFGSGHPMATDEVVAHIVEAALTAEEKRWISILRNERQRWNEIRKWAHDKQEVELLTRMDEASAAYAKRAMGPPFGEHARKLRP